MRNLSTLAEARKSLLGLDPDASLPGVPEAAGGSEEGATSTGAPFPEEEEVEEGRVPDTRKCPTGLNEEELRVHNLTHIPYHPGCKCCVAARKRDHKHPRREIVTTVAGAADEAPLGASICGDDFFPRDKPGEDKLTAIAVCYSQSQFLAAHIVDSKGSSADWAVKQVLCDLRKMGHYGNLEVRMDQESSIADFFRAVAKERGSARTVLTHAARNDFKGNGQAGNPYNPSRGW